MTGRMQALRWTAYSRFAQLPHCPLHPTTAVGRLEKKKLPASGTLGPPQSASGRVTAVGHRPTGVGWLSSAVG